MPNYSEQMYNSAPTLQHEVLPDFQNDKKSSLRKEMGYPLDFPEKIEQKSIHNQNFMEINVPLFSKT